MQTLAQIRDILAARGLSPHKRFGQNFLIDQNLGRKLVDASEIGEGDLVLEVGPGTGTLSEEILERGATLIACELDRGLSEHLRDHFGDQPRFSLIEGDCLARDRTLALDVKAALGERSFKLVANLPYGAASPLISTLLTHHPACTGLFVTIQREVAEKLAAAPGTRQYGPLALLCWASAAVRTIATLPPACFWPRPEVTSAMVAIQRAERPALSDLGSFSGFLSTLFRNRRKQLGSVLGLQDYPADVDPTARAESLSPQKVLALWELMRSKRDSGP